MYNPKYTCTDYLLYLLNQISVINDKIKSSKILPNWKVKLRRDALVESTHASTSIEGNSLNIQEVSNILLNRKEIGIRKEKKEVENYYSTLVQLEKLSKNEYLFDKSILTIHSWIMDELIVDHKPGTWRKSSVAVGNQITGKISYIAPAFDDIDELIKELLDWFNDATQLHPVLKAGIMHYKFVWIHPFADGNGRTARALATLILLRDGFDNNRFIVLDDYYNANRQEYYLNIRQTNKSNDLTQWLEYFAEGVLYSLQAVHKKIENLSGLNKNNQTKKQIYINIREETILKMFKHSTYIKSKDMQEKLKISRQAVANILKNMIKKKLIKKTGKSRAVLYELFTKL